MPWVLVATGLLLLFVAFAVRPSLITSSEVTELSVVGQGEKVSFRPRNRTITKNPLSDTAFVALCGLGGAFVLAGAFYSRVSKVGLAGVGSVEMATVAALDQAALADQVAKLVAAQTKTAGDVDPGQVAEIAAKATAAAQQSALAVRALGAPPAHVTIDAAELDRIHRGLPLSRDLLRELARSAVDDAFVQAEAEGHSRDS